MMQHIELRCRELSRQIAMMAPANRAPGVDPSPYPAADPTSVPSSPPLMSSPGMSPVVPPQPMSPPVMTAASPQIVAPQFSAPQISMGQAQAAPRYVADPQAVLDYLLSLQRSLDLNEVANVAVNDGRILLAADRVSLAMRQGQKAVIKAVSGQESVHPRGNLIRAMRRLTQKVINSGEAFRYDGSIGNVPKELEEPLAEFIQEAGARFLLIVPLLEPERLVKPDEPMGGGKPKRVERKSIGALIVEQMSSSEPSAQMKGTLDSIVDHIAAAAFNARSYSTIFLLPLWRATGHFFEWLRGRRLAIAGAILALLAVVAVALVYVPWEYRVDGKGQMMPIIQREVFAPWDGQVVKILVEEKQPVTQGQPLLELRNDELIAELVKVGNELQEKRKLLHSLKAQMDEAESQAKNDEKLKAQGKAVETQVEIEGAEIQQKILKDRLDRLIVRAPITGIVTTFQIQQLLENRPVKRGDLLLQVMDDTGDWQLELEISEHRVGRILKAQNLREKQGLDSHLAIEYRLLTSPERGYKATLKSLATRTVTAEADGSVLEARATLDTGEELPKRAIGAQVRARIGCGPSNLGDVLFGDVVEFIQKYLWW